EDLAGVAQADAFHGLVEGAGQHDAPEALDGAGRLGVTHQPVAKRGIVGGGGPAQPGQAPGDAGLVPEVEVVGAEETAPQARGRDSSSVTAKLRCAREVAAARPARPAPRMRTRSGMWQTGPLRRLFAWHTASRMIPSYTYPTAVAGHRLTAFPTCFAEVE